ncbi:MAG TPA: hypothetical protein ENG73_03390 [Desulfobacterales bacterium]|nr:hypothetical protein [Desulfobacterales bacterium]
MKQVIESTHYVVENARHVRINTQSLKTLAAHMAEGSPNIPGWDYAYHYFDETEKTLFYLFVLDTINFCFWPLPGHERWTITYQGKELSGYYALAASLKRAFEKGIPLHDAEFLSSTKMEQLQEIFSGKGQLQLMEKRLEAIRELGTYLLAKWQGSPALLVDACKGSAVQLALTLGKDLTSFADFSTYMERKIYFYKRAQILAADIHSSFAGKKFGRFHDIQQLTAFADYKLPQVLRHVGVLQYDSELTKKVDGKHLIPHGSPEEVEIRAHTIWAVELLRDEVRRMGKDIPAFELDCILWHMGQEDTYRKKPYHMTPTIFY